MRLTARSDLTEPSDSTTRAEGGPRRLSRNRLDRDEIPVLGLARHCRGHVEFGRPAERFSTGSARPDPSSALRKTA